MNRKPLSMGFYWRSLVILLLLLGLFFRVANLDRKVYWVDEVATSIRVAGYTRTEIISEVTSGKILHPQDLLNYQKLTPQRGFQETLQALTNSPEHAPLYFLMVRAWAMVFGSSAAAMRSLSVIFSLIALPCLYWLTLELFQSRFAASLALSLAAISPFFVAYAQEARPYSLWLVAILLSSLSLLRAVRLNKRLGWMFYTLSLVFGFYTSLLSIWVAVGHGIWVMIIGRSLRDSHKGSQIRNFAIALTGAFLAFTPWLWVISQHWQRLQDNTTWMRVPMDFLPRVAIGLYSIVIGFVDFPVYVPVNAVIIAAIIADIGLLTLIGFSLYFLQAQLIRPIYLFVFTLAIATPLCLVVIDWITNGQSSTAPRYLIPCQIAVQLAISFLFSQKLKPGNLYTWRWLWVVLISMGILSCAANLETSPKYQKIRNLHNLAIATVINQARLPLVIAESSETMDLLSLSRNLAENVEIKILSQSNPFTIPNLCQDMFLFNPSKEFRAAVVGQRSIEPVYQPKLLIPGEISLTLWAIKNDSCST